MSSKEKQTALIISATSDIGTALAGRLLNKKWNVRGTFRTKSQAADELTTEGAKLYSLDLSSAKSIDSACSELTEGGLKWDLLVFCPGTLEPLGLFADCDFDKWQEAIELNFTQQLRVLHRLLPARARNSQLGPCVLYFAGGGTNGAPPEQSAYISAKIALVKMCELLDAEMPDTRFVILGPGWVNTKLHQQVLDAGEKASNSHRRTVEKIASGDFTAVSEVIDCCEWIFSSGREKIGGRNFSVVSDCWSGARLDELLVKDPNLYKLRRYGNDFLVKFQAGRQDNADAASEARAQSTFDKLFAALPAMPEHHAPGSPAFTLLFETARQAVEECFSNSRPSGRRFGPFGELVFPYHRMGAIDSLNLFELNELILFSFYWANRDKYKNVADIGANIGLHSIILSRCGFNVKSFEPDPNHVKLIERNLLLNGIDSVTLCQAAVSTKAGKEEFVRVLGNTTGSHLAGAKTNPYGELERFPVTIEPVKPILAWADLLKIDVEGHEKDLLLATGFEDWVKADALVEIGTEQNAEEVYRHFSKLEVNLFSQKIGWKRVQSRSDLPTSYRDGTLFITCSGNMPWMES